MLARTRSLASPTSYGGEGLPEANDDSLKKPPVLSGRRGFGSAKMDFERSRLPPGQRTQPGHQDAHRALAILMEARLRWAEWPIGDREASLGLLALDLRRGLMKLEVTNRVCRRLADGRRVEEHEPEDVEVSDVCNGFSAVTGTARVYSRGQEILVSLAWIAKDGLVYEVLGAAPSGRWDRHRAAFAATAESFRALSPKELAEVHEDRLRLVPARANETVGEVAKRSDSVWSPAKISVANDIPENEKIPNGELIKVSNDEPYERSTLAPMRD